MHFNVIGSARQVPEHREVHGCPKLSTHVVGWMVHSDLAESQQRTAGLFNGGGVMAGEAPDAGARSRLALPVATTVEVKVRPKEAVDNEVMARVEVG